MPKTTPFEQLYTIEPNGCWTWNLTINWAGYGVAQRDGYSTPAHRYVYNILVRKLPFDIHLHHKLQQCKKSCVNPEHMEEQTQAEHNRIGGRAKINLELAREMRRLYSAGHKKLEISKQLNIVYHIVCQVIDGKSWKE